MMIFESFTAYELQERKLVRSADLFYINGHIQTLL